MPAVHGWARQSDQPQPVDAEACTEKRKAFLPGADLSAPSFSFRRKPAGERAVGSRLWFHLLGRQRDGRRETSAEFLRVHLPVPEQMLRQEISPFLRRCL